MIIELYSLTNTHIERTDIPPEWIDYQSIVRLDYIGQTIDSLMLYEISIQTYAGNRHWSGESYTVSEAEVYHLHQQIRRLLLGETDEIRWEPIDPSCELILKRHHRTRQIAAYIWIDHGNALNQKGGHYSWDAWGHRMYIDEERLTRYLHDHTKGE